MMPPRLSTLRKRATLRRKEIQKLIPYKKPSASFHKGM